MQCLLVTSSSLPLPFLLSFSELLSYSFSLNPEKTNMNRSHMNKVEKTWVLHSVNVTGI